MADKTTAVAKTEGAAMASDEQASEEIQVPQSTETVAPPIYATTVINFARDNAKRIDARGDVVDAIEMMGAFVAKMYQEERAADTEENYRAAWDEFKRS